MLNSDGGAVSDAFQQLDLQFSEDVGARAGTVDGAGVDAEARAALPTPHPAIASHTPTEATVAPPPPSQAPHVPPTPSQEPDLNRLIQEALRTMGAGSAAGGTGGVNFSACCSVLMNITCHCGCW
jgi:hypothetical protein